MVIVNAKRFPRGTFGAARLLQRCGPGLMRNAQRALALLSDQYTYRLRLEPSDWLGPEVPIRALKFGGTSRVSRDANNLVNRSEFLNTSMFIPVSQTRSYCQLNNFTS
jgi:hypothetical protein